MSDDSNTSFPIGIYDQIITAGQQERLLNLRPTLEVQTVPLRTGNTALVWQYVQHSLAAKLNAIDDVGQQLELVNRVLDVILGPASNSEVQDDQLTDKILRAVVPPDADSALVNSRPDVPLSENAVFTGGMNQLALGPQLAKEIVSSNEIYLLVSFIRQSGLDILWRALSDFAKRGGQLHVLTTTYMGATQLPAIERVAALPNTDVWISYDTRFTRLHAKVYCFLRNSGAHTAYVGSSNLTNPALTDGLEWNVRVSALAAPDLFDTIHATCEAYRHDRQFELYTPAHNSQLASALKRGRAHSASFQMTSGEVQPYRYQEAILERLQAERELHDWTRNLVVAATGTGKTVISAFDYARFASTHNRARLLFVAHRQEILEQACRTFRYVLGNDRFGTLQVGEHTTDVYEHLFISVQSLNSKRLWDTLPGDYYDYIVIDEFHHAAAPSYQKLLNHFDPQILLGLTATPERHDQKEILAPFGGRIAAEIRLPEAIDEGLLCPFRYFGLADTVDLDEIRWTRGGYDPVALENVYVLDAAVAKRRAEHVYNEFIKRVGSADDVRALGFCVSIAHAKFMARFFRDHGARADVITGDTSPSDRRHIREALERGETNVIFCVDVFNEGIDIPSVNTILLLRPTESLTIFVQQLGRGLRLHPEKDGLLVLDFIGNANRNYSFEEKFAALLRTSSDMRREVEEGFVHVPRGCYIELEEKPMHIVLNSIAKGFSTTRDLVTRVQQYVEEQGTVPNVAEFLSYYRLEPQQVYSKTSFDGILRKAGYIKGAEEPLFASLSKGRGLLRLSYMDSFRWLRRVHDLLGDLEQSLSSPLSEDDDLMLRMLYTTIWPDNRIPEMNSSEAQQEFALLTKSPRLLAEIRTLLQYLANKVAFMSIPLDIGVACPLDVHCTYTRNQILAAIYCRTMRGKQAGVYWSDQLQADVLFVTLQKTPEQFSDTTRYQDYAIDAQMFHWQTQNRTAADSETGQRYIHHAEQGSSVLLFIRKTKESSYGASPYRFLGPVEYVSSTGSKPMNIVWRLKYRMDPEFEAQISRIVV